MPPVNGAPPPPPPGGHYQGYPNRYGEPVGEARAGRLRRLSKLTWRATQLSVVSAVGFAAFFAHSAPATTVTSTALAKPSTKASTPVPSPTRTTKRIRHHARASASPAAGSRSSSSGPGRAAASPTLAPPTTAPAPSPTATPAQTKSSGPSAPGSTLFTVGGAVARPGVCEIEMGTRIGQVVMLAGGPAERLNALLVGGYFGAWLPQGGGLVARAPRLQPLLLHRRDVHRPEPRSPRHLQPGPAGEQPRLRRDRQAEHQWTLQAGSPAINHSTNACAGLTGYTTGTRDFFGNPFPVGNTFDI